MSGHRHPTAFCKVHGFFADTMIALGPGASMTITNCVTQCPRCGRPAEIVPGTYHAFSDRINLLVDRSISREALDALRKITEQAKAQKITPDEAKKEAEKVAPGAGRLFDVANWSDGAKSALYASIIGAIAVISAARISGTTTIVNVAPTTTIERIVERPVYRPQSVKLPKLEERLKTLRLERRPKGPARKSRKRH